MSITDLINLKRALAAIGVDAVVKELAYVKNQVSLIRTQVPGMTDEDQAHIDSMIANYNDLINRTVKSLDTNRSKICLLYTSDAADE